MSLFLLTTLSIPLLSSLAMRQWEYQPVKKENLPLCDIGVVLTGMTHVNRIPTDQIHFAEGADRITEAIRLHKDGLIGQIIISGGIATILDEETSESEQLKELLLTCRIREKDFKLENKSRNTYENAFYTGELLKELKLADRKILLITSAFHMRRALRCFEKQGLDVIPFPVDFHSQPITFNPSQLIPSIQSLQNWKILCEEGMGILVYRLIGYA